MSGPREVVEGVIRDALESWVESSGRYYPAGFYANDADNATTAVFDALAAAGLLVEPGSETRVEWAIRLEDDGRPIIGWDQQRAEAMYREAVRHTLTTRKLHRTVHAGPWQIVPCEHSARWASAPQDGVRTWHCRRCGETWTEPADATAEAINGINGEQP